MNDAGPKVSRRRAALTVVVALAAAGAVVGAVWALLAPPVHGVVAMTDDGDRVRAYLGNEGDHFFVSAFLMVGLLCAVAVVASVWVWQWRAHRGPILVAAVAGGAGAAAGAGATVGALLARWRYGSIDVDAAPVSPEDRVHYVVEAPAVFFGPSPLQAAVTILFPMAIAALVYALIAVATGRDDLGAWPPEEESALGPSVTTVSVPPAGR